MRTAVLCAALLALPAWADNLLVVREGNDMIRLADDRCQSEQVLQRLPVELHAHYRSATAVLQGVRFSACWRRHGSAAHIVYEDGDQGVIPMANLKPELMA